MKKKIIFATAVGLGMALVPISSVFAEETVLTVTVPETPVESYVLTIPAEQEISAFVNSEHIGSVSVAAGEEGTIFPTAGVTVSASHTSFAMAGSSTSFDFVLGTSWNAENDWTGATWTSEDAKTGKSVDNYVNIADKEWAKATSGSYTATITYTATVNQ